MELNSIKPSGTWGQASTQINENFSKTSSEVEKLKLSLKLFKGYFLTEASLKASVSSPRIGDYAYVGNAYPGVVYNCTVQGVWVNTGRIPNIESVNLADYAKKEDTYAMVAQLNTATFDVSKIKGMLNTVAESGFHFPDSTGADVMNYTADGFDAAKVSPHFIELLNSEGVGGMDYEIISDKIYNF